ncbi:MAG: hypothetical protein COV07_01605 [Candidatus Vogelbacteria bacterium CG10_big_fil_rev_8_21_14_0_10_45_14]|uniref:Uncharacterized protein n=1 Tax=Candidatus Vogelbacteria bacterium CG10_big_fil_rev_8_21_14_0_10_45_14 TaxID=1975042 RepID=A0A2H0RKF4_9BACT|nr:MAG: hypothetical protein COV07_01605 [Candidatus Vogelbacteria bacterium CG10_big_fil_rev_8_21_14_0_10_45_14]
MNFLPQRKMKKVKFGKEIFLRLFDFDKGRYEPHPRRDFAILLSCTVVALALLMIVVIYLNYKYSPRRLLENIPPPVQSEKGLVDLTTLEAVLTEFRAREDAFRDILSGSTTPSVADPAQN